MVKIENLFSGIVLVAPVAIGALVSGIFYLAEGAAIPLTIFQLALLFSFAGFALKKLVLQDLSIKTYGLEKWWLMFLGIIFISIIYTPEREQALFYSIRLIILLSLTYLVYNAIESRRDLRILCYIIIGVSVLIGVANILQFYLNPETVAFNYLNQGKRLMRQRGVESDPNVFASNFILPLLLLVSFFSYVKKRWQKVGIFGITALIIAPVLLSYSRSAWVAIFVGLIIVMAYKRRFDFVLYGGIAFLLVFISSSTLQNLVFTLFERLIDIFAGTKDDSSRFRIILALTSIRILFDSYLMGIGYQGFSSKFQEYYPPQETIGIYEPHNEFYAVYAELGIIGFAIFLIILWKIFSRAKKALSLYAPGSLMQSIALAIFASFISYIVFFQFLSGMFFNSIFIILIGLVFCTHKLADPKYAEELSAPADQ